MTMTVPTVLRRGKVDHVRTCRAVGLLVRKEERTSYPALSLSISRVLLHPLFLLPPNRTENETPILTVCGTVCSRTSSTLYASCFF